MQTFYFLQASYRAIFERCFKQPEVFLEARERETSYKTMEDDFPRSCFVSPYASADDLFERSKQMENFWPFYLQGNYVAREISDQIVQKIQPKIYSSDEGRYQRIMTNKHHLSFHYENDSHQNASLSIIYIAEPGQTPIWLISHVDDISQAIESRPYTLFISEEMNNLISYKYEIKEITVKESEKLETDRAGLFNILTYKLKSQFISDLIAPIFQDQDPVLAIEKLKQRLAKGPQNLDNRDEKILALMNFIRKFAPQDLPVYQQRFTQEPDFFEATTYFGILKQLKLSLAAASSPQLEVDFQNLMMQQLRLAMRRQTQFETEHLLDFCQGSIEEFEAKLMADLKTKIEASRPPIAISKYLALYAFYLETYSTIFELPPESNKLETLKAQLRLHIQHCFNQKIQAFKQSLNQDLSGRLNYWQARQSWLKEKKQELQQLTEDKQELMKKLNAELVIDDCKAELNKLEQYQDLLRADMASIWQDFPDIISMRAQIESQEKSTDNYFDPKYYREQLIRVFDQIQARFSDLDLSQAKFRLMKRANDLYVRHQHPHYASEIEDFWRLYFAAENEADYTQKIKTHLELEIQAFQNQLVLTETTVLENEVDIAQTKWEDRLQQLKTKYQLLQDLNARMDEYLNLVQLYSPDTFKLVRSQILHDKKQAAQILFEQFGSDCLIHQNAYRQFIHEANLKEAMDLQFTAWSKRLTSLQTYPQLLAFQKKIAEIFRQMIQENDNLAHTSNQDNITTRFSAFSLEVANKVKAHQPPSFFHQLNQRWQANHYKDEILVISAALATAAVCNPMVLGASIALGIAAICIGLILFATLRILAQSMVTEAVARPSILP